MKHIVDANKMVRKGKNMSENKEATEAIEAVTKINEEIYEQTEEKNGICFFDGLEFSTNGFSMGIEFLGDQIWCDEDDERKYDEDKDEYEPLEGFLRRQIAEVLKKTEKIKV